MILHCYCNFHANVLNHAKTEVFSQQRELRKTDTARAVFVRMAVQIAVDLVPESGSQASVSLSHSDVQIGTTEVTLRISFSITDQFRRGASMCLAATGTSLRPVRAVPDHHAYRLASSPILAFLLQASGTPLMRSQFVDTFRKCLNVTGVPCAQLYSPHSFHIGAATTAAMTGVPGWLIQACGRWFSDCLWLYIQAQPSQLDQVTRALAAD